MLKEVEKEVFFLRFMKKFFVLDIKRILHSPLLWISLGIGIVLGVIHFFVIGSPYQWRYWRSILQEMFHLANMDQFGELGELYPFPWISRWIGGDAVSIISVLFFMGIPVLAAIPYGNSIAVDHTNGYIKNLYIRGEKKSYYISKAISSFLTGGLVICIPLLINIGLCIATMPHIKPAVEGASVSIYYGNMWSVLYYEHPYLYVLGYLLIIFVYSGLLSCLATGVSAYFHNRFFSLVFPFTLVLFFDSFVGAMQHPEWAIENFIVPDQRCSGITFPIVVSVALVLLIIDAGLLVLSEKQDETI